MASFLENNEIGLSILEEIRLIRHSDFYGLSRGMRYELLKNTIIDQLVTDSDCHDKDEYSLTADGMELKIIFNFLDLMVHENRTVDIAPKRNLLLYQ